MSACSTPAGEVVDRVPDGRSSSDAVVVASFNFPESELLAEMYAAVLENEGIEVDRQVHLGPREIVGPALLQGHVDVVPEYVGSALPAVSEPGSGVRLLAPAAAQNQNALVVTRSTAERLGLETLSDLTTHAPDLTLGGPSECPEREYCLRGLARVYKMDFAGFVPLDGASRTYRGLQEGVVDVAVMFTTDGHLAMRDLVMLDDDRHLQPPENVVPAVRDEVVERHGERVVAAIDRVSERLTTTSLRLLNWRVSIAGRSPRAEAEGWLLRQGLLPR